jgi:hypothetical protein
MSATRVRYLLRQWHLRSLAVPRLEGSKEKAPLKPAGPAPSSRPPPEKGPATPE